MHWNDRFASMSEKMFPGLVLSKPEDDFIPDGNQVMSNLPLQMALYFNVILAPFWTIILILYLYDNYASFSDFYKFITVTIVVAVFLIEVLRLYLGYRGNLKDKIPELAGFWMLSLLLQFPLQGFLLFNPYFKFYIMEITVQGLMFIMLCVQLFASYSALKFTASQQTVNFKHQQLRNDITINDIRERFKHSKE